MSQPRAYRVVGLTLRKTSVGEADIISSLYTREHGKLDVLARGARRLTSKLMGHFEPLTLVRLSVARGRSLDTVAEAEVINAFPGVKAAYETAARGLHVAEVVEGYSAASAPNPRILDLATQTLDAIGRQSIASGAPPSDMPLRYFDLQLLRLSGFMPELYQCVECGNDLEPDRHRFAAGAGGALCLDCGPEDVVVRPLSLSALKVMRLLHRTESVDGLPPLNVPPPVRNEVNSLLTDTVQYWLDRQLRSQAFIIATESA